MGFYWMYFSQNNTSLDMEWIIFNQSSNNNTAQADYIAKIVDFNGTFYIENQLWNIVQTSNITNWDTIIIKEKAQIIFHISDWTKAKIIGPAKFNLQKTNWNSYKLNLIYWEYVEMASLQSKNTQNISISVDNITVSQWEKTKPIDFQLIKQGKNHVIKNNWSKLIVSTPDNKNSTSLGNKQILAIQNNDISLFDSFEKFAKAVKNKDLSQTFVLNDNIIKNSTGTGSTGDVELAMNALKALDDNDILNINENDPVTIPSDIVPVLQVEDKTVASPDQTKLISTQLNKDFLNNNLNQISVAYLQWKKSELDKAILSLDIRLEKIALSFGISYTSPSGDHKAKISSIKSSASKIYSSILDKYLIPPKYTDNLKKISNTMWYLESKVFWSLGTSTTENVISSLPDYIK